MTVSNTSGHERYADLALTHIFPAGWEITSERDLSSLTYQDIRDDRVLSYFDLSRGESKEIPVKLTATYKGRYYLPSVYCEAMYDNAVRALKRDSGSRWSINAASSAGKTQRNRQQVPATPENIMAKRLRASGAVFISGFVLPEGKRR